MESQVTSQLPWRAFTWIDKKTLSWRLAGMTGTTIAPSTGSWYWRYSKPSSTLKHPCPFCHCKFVVETPPISCWTTSRRSGSFCCARAICRRVTGPRALSDGALELSASSSSFFPAAIQWNGTQVNWSAWLSADGTHMTATSMPVVRIRPLTTCSRRLTSISWRPPTLTRRVFPAMHWSQPAAVLESVISETLCTCHAAARPSALIADSSSATLKCQRLSALLSHVAFSTMWSSVCSMTPRARFEATHYTFHSGVDGMDHAPFVGSSLSNFSWACGRGGTPLQKMGHPTSVSALIQSSLSPCASHNCRQASAIHRRGSD